MPASVPEALLRRLQLVLNAAARLVFSASKYSHASPLLGELHWLKVPDRIKFPMCMLPLSSLLDRLAETMCPVSSCALRQRLRFPDLSTLTDPVDTLLDTWRPRVSGGGSRGLELSACSCQGCDFTARFPPST